jgi:hypothetical protein
VVEHWSINNNAGSWNTLSSLLTFGPGTCPVFVRPDGSANAQLADNGFVYIKDSTHAKVYDTATAVLSDIGVGHP